MRTDRSIFDFFVYVGRAFASVATIPALVLAQEEPMEEPEAETKEPVVQHARIYRSPEERREAGLGREITDWLKLSGLVELEKEYAKNKFSDSFEMTDNPDTIVTLQVASIITVGEWLESEIIFEAEYDRKYRSKMDEVMVGVDIEDWGFKFGKQYIPFGEYYSHLVIGPSLEFGETRRTSLIVDYGLNDNVELAAYFFESEVDQIGKDNGLDWGFMAEYVSDNESIRVAASYVSDLAEADESLIGDYASFERRVPGWNAYALIGMNTFEVTAEIVQATRRFAELDPDRDKPTAYNVELAYFIGQNMQVAGRIEHSSELDEQPEWQYGLGATMVLAKHVTLSVDYLYGDFKDGFIFDDEEEFELDHRHMVAAQLAIEF